MKVLVECLYFTLDLRCTHMVLSQLLPVEPSIVDIWTPLYGTTLYGTTLYGTTLYGMDFASNMCVGCGISLSKQAVRPVLHSSNTLLNHALRFSRQYARGNQRPSSQQKRSSNPLVRYLHTLRWVPIPLGVGFAYISYQQYGHVVKREERKLHTNTDPEELLATDWLVCLYQCVPLKIISRLWGAINSLNLPTSMRGPLYRAYSRKFGCNLEEAAIRDLEHYRNLSEFFKRRLRPGVRPVDSKSLITCPCDGVVLHFGEAKTDRLEQVKGITYSLQEFIGPKSWPNSPSEQVPTKVHQHATSRTATGGKVACARYMEQLKSSADNALYHCVIYLAPGDYHGFHSPTEWVVSHRRHFPGELLSVNPGMARVVRGLFNLNERAVYVGHYKHGFFAMAAVGATNVGNIKVYHDQYLSTNQPGGHPKGVYLDESYHALALGGIPMKKGESFGEFNLGSTIVLVFEAPKDFDFKIRPGQKVKYGQPLGGGLTIPK